ncbi:cysteine dioxygenase type I [Candidatus Koribacter versatilis Ellin345]|uniref:Cysteine dioxygenase type I n=1 Tax=Koribacter versatilis (strain Ellin345) TaxID=204669 RepID=Q1IN62_KORVE|nr:cysteine dioxygenase family protein [Candidatus Koribacter versatilis]ABF41688.1 cysteine dioxygenase type I [Candidatus Koribacter versatilis Ellin345]
MATKPALATVSIEKYVELLRQLPAEAFDDVPRIEEFALQNPVDPATLERFLCWDAQHYTRNLIDHTDLYDLMAICWDIGQISSIHNHRGQNCWMSVPIGTLRVQNYRVISENVAEHRCEIVPTDVIDMTAERPVGVNPDHPVHSVENRREFNERAVSLHIYSKPFDSCVVYSDEQGTCGEINLHFTTKYGERSPRPARH